LGSLEWKVPTKLDNLLRTPESMSAASIDLPAGTFSTVADMIRAAHLAAAGISLAILALAVVAFTAFAQQLESRYVNALADGRDDLQIQSGLALQRAALRQADLLPIFGGSEVLSEDSRYTAYHLFQTYPTGFDVFDVAQGGASFLTIAQDLAALGPALHGHKVVISFTPSSFETYDLNAEPYAGNFSDLHANWTAFSPDLSLDLKQGSARRMLEFPQTLQADPLLNFALEQLADGSSMARLQYYLAWPLGLLQASLLQLQDHAAVVLYIWSHSGLAQAVQRDPAAVDWQALHQTALAEQLTRTRNNPYGVDDVTWTEYQDQKIVPVAAGSRDQQFLDTVGSSAAWGDLDLLLQILRQYGAQPLILSRPINASLWEAFGVTRPAQETYYSRLQAAVLPYSFGLVDFQAYSDDRFFSTDGPSHPSREGWVYVDQVLDQFFHGVLK
jgi:D-alanine transfer protein